MDALVIQKLRDARVRLIWATYLHLLPWALLLGLSGLLAYRLAWTFSSLRPLRPAEMAIALGLPILVAFVWAAFRWRNQEAVAREVDTRAGTKDRLITFLHLSEAAPSEFRELSAREIARQAASGSWSKAISIRLRLRHLAWCVLPLAGLITLHFVDLSRRAAAAPEAARASRMLEAARQAVARQPVPDQARLKELDQAMERVKTSPDPRKEAMSALADLESKLAQSANSAGLSPEEAAALASAVASANPSLAESLREGRQGEAAQELSKMDPEAVKQALEQASQHVESNRLRDLARQASPEAKRQLARLMQASPGSEGAGGSDQQRRLASALQDAKNGDPSNDQGQGEFGQGKSSDAPNGNTPSQAGQSDDAQPGGAAGSDKDHGQGSDISGQRDPKTTDPSQEDALSGIMGSGASLVEAYRATGNDNPTILRAYREAYQTATAAALDSINREDVPAASRLMVKRYFESIRPKE